MATSSWINHEIKDIIADAEALRAQLHDAQIQNAVLKARLDETKEVQTALIDMLKQMAVYEFILKQHGIDPETGQQIVNNNQNGV